MTVKKLNLYSTTGGKIYQSEEDAESHQKMENFEFDFKEYPFHLYIDVDFEMPRIEEILDSGEFLNYLEDLKNLYNKIYKQSAPARKTVVLEPKKMGFYDRLAAAIYLVITGTVRSDSIHS